MAFYAKYLSPFAELSWGIFDPDSSNFDYNTLRRYEDAFDYEFPVILNYTQVSDRKSNLYERLVMAYNEGKVMELTLQMTALDEGHTIGRRFCEDPAANARHLSALRRRQLAAETTRQKEERGKR